MRKIKEIYWGWRVVAGAFVLLFITYGARYSFGVFVKPMFVEYDWPMAVISMAASINLLAYATTGVLAGWLLDKLAPRWIMTIGIVVTTIGLVAASFVKTPLGLYLSYGLLCGIGFAGTGAVASNAAVGKWFLKKRGLAMGVATMGIGVGTLAVAPLAGYIVQNFGWRIGFLFFALMTFVVGISTSQILMGKTGPREHGLLPDGAGPDACVPNPLTGSGCAETVSLKPVIVDSRFWLLAFCNIAAVMTVMMTFVHQIPYAVNSGIDKVEAAAALGITGLTGSLGKFFFGWISDRIPDAKYSAALGFFLMAVGMYFLYQAKTVMTLYLFALIFGFGYGSLAPVTPYLISDRFGQHILGVAYGLLIFFATGVGGSIGPLLGGLIFDRTGSYVIGWLLNMMVLLLVSFLILLLKSARTIPTDQALSSRC
ncbi:MAG: MFS transporter [Desulfobacterales bacterium]|nr:MAG: MFS transporter [Desulfobacterales bacterium]